MTVIFHGLGNNVRSFSYLSCTASVKTPAEIYWRKPVWLNVLPPQGNELQIGKEGTKISITWSSHLNRGNFLPGLFPRLDRLMASITANKSVFLATNPGQMCSFGEALITDVVPPLSLCRGDQTWTDEQTMIPFVWSVGYLGKAQEYM